MQKALIAAFLASLPMLPVRAWAQAEDLFKAQCSSCHGMDGSGSTPAGRKLGVADLRSQQVQSLTDQKLFDTIAYGIKHKQYPHAFAKRGMTEKQIADLVVLIRKLPKK